MRYPSGPALQQSQQEPRRKLCNKALAHSPSPHRDTNKLTYDRTILRCGWYLSFPETQQEQEYNKARQTQNHTNIACVDETHLTNLCLNHFFDDWDYNDDIELGRREDHVKIMPHGLAACRSGVWRCQQREK